MEMETMRNVGALLLAILIYVGLPILLVIRWRKRKKSGKKKVRKSYKIISIPLLILNAIPACVIGFCMEGEVNYNEDFWYAVMFAFFAIEMVITIVKYKWSGIWIGIVRFLIGTSVGLLAAVAVLVFLGLLLILGYAGSSGMTGTITIYANGKLVTLEPQGEEGIYYNPHTGETFRRYDSRHVRSCWNGKEYGIE